MMFILHYESDLAKINILEEIEILRNLNQLTFSGASFPGKTKPTYRPILKMYNLRLKIYKRVF